MNERLSGVYVYGGGPQQHYVFRGEAQRRRKLRAITLALAVIFAILLAWVVRLTYLEVAQPQVASAEAPQAAQVEQAPAAEQAPAQAA